MKNISSEELLKVSLSNPEKVFTGNIHVAKLEYHAMARYWHPDKNKDADAHKVLAHLNNLYAEAKRRIENGTWQGSGMISYKVKDQVLTISYSKIKPFELGDRYFGRNQIIYSVKKEYMDFFRNAKSILSNLRYPNENNEKQMKMFLPIDCKYLVTDDRAIMIIPKTEDMIPLQDLLDYCRGSIPPVHVAYA